MAGAFVDGEGAKFPTQDPATGNEIAQVVSADEALSTWPSPWAFQEDWRQHSPRERAGMLRDVAGLIRDHADEIAALAAWEVGKPKREALRPPGRRATPAAGKAKRQSAVGGGQRPGA